MSLTSRQAEIWSNKGATDSSKKTYRSVDTALNEFDWPDDIKYKIYLQGSYRNSTNIRGDSDVDIVIQFNSIFRRSLSRLQEDERAKYKKDHSPASRTIQELQNMVYEALIKYYKSQNVNEGDKAIKVNTPYLEADVVPCLQYRYYLSYDSKPGEYLEGIAIYSSKLQSFIINFPKKHIENGEIKNSNTSGTYKPMVRVFKNARNVAIQENLISADKAPSYYIECLMYNVPNSLYENNYVKATDDILHWLSSSATITSFNCQHNLYSLFGNRYDQWNKRDCVDYIRSLNKII